MQIRKKREAVTSRRVVGGVSDAGEVFLQRGEEVPYDGHAPRPSQKPLPGETTHVGHVGVMDGEAKNSVTWT